MSAEQTIEQIAEEFISRLQDGYHPSMSEYISRYPQLEDEIRELFPAIALIEKADPTDESWDDAVTGEVTSDGTRLKQVGEYRIVREIGRGGMGVVYEAEQQSLGRHVALKVLPYHSLMDPTQLKRFHREARAAARLHHTNIVPVFGVGEHDGIHYYAMQFIRGQGLDEVIDELIALETHVVPLVRENSAVESQSPAPGPLATNSSTHEADDDLSSPDLMSPRGDLSNSSTTDRHFFRSVARLGVQAAEALAYAHGQGILHRDVKPSNLMLDSDGKLWVTDFGLAKTDAKDELTHTGDLVGTLRYMAPERFDGWSDPRSDIYGLGLTLYEMLTLKPAYQERDRAKLIRRITQETLPDPRRLNRAIPVDLETIVLKAIAREPSERYTSADQLAADLRCYLASKPIMARRTSWRERTWMWCHRNPMVAALVALVMILLVTTSVVSVAAAVRIYREKNIAQTNLSRAEKAERSASRSATTARQAELRERSARVTAQHSVYAARLAQARAGRWSGRPGRGFGGLQAIREATEVARALDLGPDAILELRNEAIACMALVDVRLERSWPESFAATRVRTGYDRHAELYALIENGRFVIRRVDDNSEVQSLPGFGDPRNGACLRLSPDGRMLAAKGRDGRRIRTVVWDLTCTEPIVDEDGFGSGWEVDLAFSRDGKMIAFTGRRDAVFIHELNHGNRIASLPVTGRSAHLQFDPKDQRLAISQSGTDRVLVFDVVTQQILQTLQHAHAVEAVAWSPTGEQLGVACHDGNIHIWDVATGRKNMVCGGHSGKVIHVAFSPRGDMLASSAWEMASRIWDPRTGRQLLEIEERLGFFSHDGQRLTTCGPGRYRVATADVLKLLVGHQDRAEIVDVVFSADGQLLVSTGHNDGCYIWSATTGERVFKLPNAIQVRSAFFTPDSRYLLTTGSAIQFWPIVCKQTQTQRIVRIGNPQTMTERASTSPGDRVHLPPSSRTLAKDEIQAFLSVDNRGTEPRPARSASEIRFVTGSPDGRWVATGAKFENRIQIRDGASGTNVHEINLQAKAIPCFSPDGAWLVTNIGDGDVQFWETGSWKESHRIDLERRGHSRIAFSPDMRLMAVVDSYEVVLVDPNAGNVIARLAAPSREQLAQAYPEGASGLCFSPDGAQLAVGSDGGVIQLWDLRLVRRQLKDLGLDWDHPAIPDSVIDRSVKLSVQMEATP